MGGKLTGALWTGAAYITGSAQDDENQHVETGRVIKPNVYDVEKQLTHEDLKLL